MTLQREPDKIRHRVPGDELEFFIDLKTLGMLMGLSYQTVKRWSYPEGRYSPTLKGQKQSTFPKPRGSIAPRPGLPRSRLNVFALSEVIGWLKVNRPYDVRVIERFGEIGQDLIRSEAPETQG